MAFYTLPNDYAERGKRLTRDGLTVKLADGTPYTVRQLLTEQDDNIKLAKSGKVDGAKFYTVGLSLAPYTLAGMGSVCASASPACIAGCLNTAGKGLVKDASGRQTVQNARIAKTRAALARDTDTRADFVSMLVWQLERAKTRARKVGLRLAVRLNVLSDLPWENMAPWLFERLPDVQFYDYTKVYARLGTVPSNYDLTFSRSEKNDTDCASAIARGFRVAVVFNNRKPLPETWNGARVVDADLHDMRFLDGPGVVSGLKAKGKLRGSDSPFVVW
jgi:hypothetical protein